MADRKVTFFHRCDQHDMPPLGRIDAVEGLRRTILEAGGSIDDDALQRAVDAVDGSPYRLQVVGHAAWQIAGAPDSSVDLSAAELATAAADEIVDRNVSVPALYDLSDAEQAALRAIVDAGPGATVSAVSARTGATHRQAGRIVRRLRLSGYVAQSESGAISLTGLVPERVVDDQMPSDDSDTQWHHAIPAPPQATMCRKWMPRAQARCILTEGHAGGCRSR
ncbi:MAG: helix-turn-helix domain-containing protein [Acidimicrobiaceae bacterium]|nr:helix-turn-helix domain-containing protein [Acidimicrobiaceae bacterium]